MINIKLNIDSLLTMTSIKLYIDIVMLELFIDIESCEYRIIKIIISLRFITIHQTQKN